MGVGARIDRGCVVIGSGPSLNSVDVTRLADVQTMAFNRSYVAWRKWGFAPTYYAALDPIVVADNADEIRILIRDSRETRFFLSEDARRFGIEPSSLVTLIGLEDGELFSGELPQLTDFGNVGATSIQLLALLGYRRIALIGIDARYDPLPNIGSPDKDGFVTVTNDPNHFCPEYVQGKRQSARPDLERILGRWPLVARECTRHGIEVRNASPGSALSCFPPADFRTAVAWVLDGSRADRDGH